MINERNVYTSLKYNKKEKAPAYDGINIELMKYAPTELHYTVLDLLTICWRTGECGVAILIPICKK
jgi:hypothetical protein